VLSVRATIKATIRFQFGAKFQQETFANISANVPMIPPTLAQALRKETDELCCGVEKGS
jgi:hypothetical protein